MNSKTVAKYAGATIAYVVFAYLASVGAMIAVGALAFFASRSRAVRPAQRGRLGITRRKTRRSPSSSRLSQ